jgi:hypothetical protein
MGVDTSVAGGEEQEDARMASPDAPREDGRGSAAVAERYGRDAGRRPSRAVRLVLLLALGVGFVAAVVALALPQLAAPVSFVVRTFSVVDDDTVRVGWELARDPGAVVECLVRARGEDGAEVGNELVVVPASPGRRTVVSHDLTTAAPAVTGEVRSCIVVGP